MNPFATLFAAINVDVLETIVVLIIAAVAGMAKLLANMQQARPPANMPPRPQRPPRPAPNNIAGQIDDLLQRAAQQRFAQQREAQPALRQKAAGQERLPRREPLKTAATQPIQAEVVAGPVGGQVAEHVQKYLDTQDFSRRGAQLGEAVSADVDREIDQHLHQVFDHSVSQLAATPGETATQPTTTTPAEPSEAAAEDAPVFAADLVAILTNPDSVGQAIMLSEIIHRPEERW